MTKYIMFIFVFTLLASEPVWADAKAAGDTHVRGVDIEVVFAANEVKNEEDSLEVEPVAADQFVQTAAKKAPTKYQKCFKSCLEAGDNYCEDASIPSKEKCCADQCGNVRR